MGFWKSGYLRYNNHDTMWNKFLNKYRYSFILLRELVITDFKLRYQNSLLGYLWALLRPLFLFVVLYVVFAVFLRIGDDIENWPVALLLGIVMWNFFSEITRQGQKAIVNSGNIIRKINFPKYIIVISTSLSAVINLVINLFVVGIFAVITQLDFTWGMLLIPVYVFEVYIFALGIAFLLGTINVRYRDIGYIWDVFSQALFYGSAIMYPITKVIENNYDLAIIILLNPLALAIQDMRHFAINPELPTLYQLTDSPWIVALPHILVFVTMAVGAWYFRRQSPKFAENV